jgi:hypothetical protein
MLELQMEQKNRHAPFSDITLGTAHLEEAAAALPLINGLL